MTDKLTKDNLDKEYPAILTALGGDVTKAQDSIRVIQAVGDGEHRHFHHFQHFLDIANALSDTEGQSPIHSPQIKVVAKHAGLFHDIVYHHVDGFHDSIKPAMGKYIGTITDGKPLETYNFLDDGTPITAMAKTIFNLQDGVIPNAYSGGNELLSAIYAAKRGQAEGIPEKYLLAEMAIIEATIPFQSADRMDHLATRLESANKTLPADKQLTDTEIKDTMHAATHIANMDVIGFRLDSQTMEKGANELIEEAMSSGETKIDATNKQLKFLQTIYSKLDTNEVQIFHSYDAAPSKSTLEEWHDTAKENISKRISVLDTPASGCSPSDISAKGPSLGEDEKSP